MIDDGPVPDADGVLRCPWGADPAMLDYHDREWGRPVLDEQGLFERVCLESFQSGLSWLVILRKRDRFREAFAGFDPEAVAAFGDHDVERLMGDAGIVRNRRKIEAAVGNARAVLDLEGGFVDLLQTFRPEPAPPAPRTVGDVPAVTPESTAMAAALKAAGFRFVGPTTAYALMQATGMVDDHLVGCVARGST
ncbi:DNA-3-methyladenine glycosylase I [Aeromicrobium sp. CF3.5]|uniref:DNA-3-methyladenine glycosylase I n=1 Tax=Aeromicrobium sp. CF3.5 TaxID=3373078 RepID=UPI003EE6014A